MLTGVIIYHSRDQHLKKIEDEIARKAGYELVGIYDDCAEADLHIEVLKPRVALIDLDLEPAPGLSIVRKLRNRFPELSILVISSREDAGSLFDSLHAGANGYLLKDTSPERTLEAIEDVLQGGVPMPSTITRLVLDQLPTRPLKNLMLERLTAREQQVLKLMMKGESYKMVAANLGVSMGTVQTYVKRIYDKLQVHSKTEAINKAFPNKNVD